MRQKATRIDARSSVVVDTCGTGGDGSNTFNISTTTAFVVAAAGLTVAKHGNRAVSSGCGSADVLEALGVKIDAGPEIVEECLQEIGIGFLFAPRLHGAMKYAIGPRREIGIRTIFNMLGPLTNPAGATSQLIGVYDPKLTEMFAGVLKNLGTKRAFVVHGADGLDEATVTGETRVSELKEGLITTYNIDPLELFGETYPAADLRGGDAEANARITTEVLSGEPAGGLPADRHPQRSPRHRGRGKGRNDPGGDGDRRGLHRQRRRPEEAPGADRAEQQLTDGFGKSPDAALRFILRHCGVRKVRLMLRTRAPCLRTFTKPSA